MFGISKIKNTVLCVLAGTLLGVSLVHALLWPLVFIGGVLTLHIAHKARSNRKAFFLGWAISCTKMLWVLAWFWSAYPVDWLGLSPGPFHIFLLCLYWIPAAITLGVGTGVFMYCYHRYLLACRLQLFVRAGLVGLLWMLCEVFGTFVFSLYTLGPGSSISPGFSFGNTGYALAEHHVLIFGATFMGVYGLCFLVGLCIFFLATLTFPRRACLFVILVVTAFIPAPSISKGAHNIQVAIVGTSFSAPAPGNLLPYSERWRIHREYLDAALKTKSSAIVLPEDMRLSSWFDTEDELLTQLEASTSNSVVLVDSNRVVEDGVTVQRALIYDTIAHEVDYFDKQYLVPQGEFIPYVYRVLISLLYPRGSIADAVEETNYRPGINQATVITPNYVPPVLFCFESVTPFGVRNVLKNKQDAPYVAHIVSHAWFKRDPQMLWHQLDAMLRVQALYNQVTIVQAANLAPLKVYYPNGTSETPPPVASGNGWEVAVVRI
jgi:apolipoprotein N-acyltransferase